MPYEPLYPCIPCQPSIPYPPIFRPIQKTRKQTKKCYQPPQSKRCQPPIKECRSCEIRGSILYTRCECIRRNGLQQDCPRRLCQGKPCCLTTPDPRCCPAKHAKRLLTFPPRSRVGPCRPESMPTFPICMPCTPPSPEGPFFPCQW
ncbi:uncharacterized protein LOC119659885 isoform X2 [Hermetia illucens]|nr:uncharacterized protein LOC119659885 isoform X2 [Hermetia illucens]